MAIRRYEPRSLLDELSRELGRLGEDATTSADTSSLATSDWAPAVDIREERNRYVIEADLPGVEPGNIEIDMQNGLLSISGRRVTGEQGDEHRYTRVERAAGAFHRRFSLPETVDADNVSARTENGVLRISIPKQERTQPRKIKVEG